MTHYISDKFGEFTVFNQDGVINAVYKNDWGNSPEKKVFQIEFDEKLFNKLTGYKTVRGLRAFCEKHLSLVFHLPRDLDDRSRTVSTLGDDVPNQLLPSDDCSDSPILPPVAASSPATSDTPLFIDTETTGLGYLEEVVEIAIVDVDENILFESLVKPKVPITVGACDVHCITNDMVYKTPKFSDILPTIQHIVKGRDLVFYNAAFDKGKIARTAFTSLYPKSKNLSANFDDYFDNPTSCLMREYAKFWGDWSEYHGSYIWQSLVNACYQQGISIDDIPNHRASGDAIKTARLWRKRHEVGWNYPDYSDDAIPF